MKQLTIILASVWLSLTMVTGQAIQKLPTAPKAVMSTDGKTGEKIKELYYVLKADQSVKHSEYRAYNMNDSMLLKGSYNKGVKQGEWTAYYSDVNNYVQWKGSYLENNKTGKWNYYHNAAGRKIKETVLYGGGNPVVTQMHRSGGVSGKGSYKAGSTTKIGKWAHLYANGRTESEGTYSSGKKTGEWKVYYTSGALKTIEKYNSSGKLNGDKVYYDSGNNIEKTEYYVNGRLDRVEDKFTFLGNELEPLLEKVKETYLASFPKIYKNEINGCQEGLETFKSSGRSAENLKRGTGLKQKLIYAQENFKTITEIKQKIAANLLIINEKSGKEFPKLTKALLDNLKPEKDAFDKAVTVDTKLQSGKAFQEKVATQTVLLEKAVSDLKTITEKDEHIDQSLKGPFPAIHSSDYLPVKAKVESYKALTSLQERIDQSPALIAELQMLSDKSDNLIILDNKLNGSESVMSKYKDSYQNIYKNLSKLYENAIAKFNSYESLDEKINEGNAVMSYVNKLEQDYVTLNTQQEVIDSKIEEFAARLKSDKKNKYIYKRGMILVNIYKGAYKKQALTTRRLSVGNDIVQMLDQFLGYAGHENFELNEALKETVTPQEMKDAFGL